MITVEVRNFQGIEQASICIEGFTALVGRSNIGKSSFVRAMKAALTNELGTSFVRHERSSCARQKGAKSCKCFASVHIVQGSDFNLLWKKGDAENGYVFNGKSYDKPGQGIPDFLLKAGLAPVKIGNDFETIQVADQFFPIFLLNQSGPAAAEAISDVARLDKISVAMKAADKDRREAVSSRKVRSEDILNLEIKGKTFEGLDLACSKSARVESSLKIIDVLEKKRSALTSYAEKTSILVVDLRSLSEASKILVPDIELVKSTWGEVEQQTDFHVKFLATAGDYKRLLGVDKLGAPPLIDPLVDIRKSVRLLEGWSKRLQAFRPVFERLELAEKAKLPVPDSLAGQKSKVKTLTGYVSRVSVVTSQVEKLEKEVTGFEKEERLLQSEIEVLGEFCPTCNQPVVGHEHA